ncbi:uncharacterized protein LOC119336202 isoform X3 [Triticum dicoccoides]|uniref:uncharacterized protein LOC119336202 isoform X3 n=1 Tax=Triticum dicoccoides TaxID=85692 RepID=UPI00189161F0|nr:uncharacterized protein LOC119336202 isoform X3 [Triticum dicoccoides]
MSSAHPLPVASWGSWGVSNRAVWLLLDWISWHLIFFCRSSQSGVLVAVGSAVAMIWFAPFVVAWVPLVYHLRQIKKFLKFSMFCLMRTALGGCGCLADWRRTLEGRNVSRRTTERSEQI